MSKKKKNNLIILHIYKETNNILDLVIYKPYLNVITKELFNNAANVFDTSTWNTMLDYTGIYDSHVLMNYKALKPAIQQMYDENYLKSYITFIIQRLKQSERNYQRSFEENHNCIILQSAYDDSLNKMYEGTVTRDGFKEFIVYLMKEYKVDTKLAYMFYKNGLKEKTFCFNFDIIFPDTVKTLKRFYKSNKEIQQIEHKVFSDFWLMRKKLNVQ